MPNTTLKAPRGKFRVVGVDTFEAPTADYLIADVDTLDEAKALARHSGGEMNPVYVYDQHGTRLFKAGKY